MRYEEGLLSPTNLLDPGPVRGERDAIFLERRIGTYSFDGQLTDHSGHESQLTAFLAIVAQRSDHSTTWGDKLIHTRTFLLISRLSW
jgi:hypothetical protein